MFGVVVATVPILSLILYYMFRRKRYDRLPPGPAQKLVVGNMMDLDSNRVHQSLDALGHTYGPIVYVKLLQKDVIVLNNADVIRKAFAEHEDEALFNDKPTGFYGTYLCFGHKNVLLGRHSDVTFKMKDVMQNTMTSSVGECQIAKEAHRLLEAFSNSCDSDTDPRDIVEDSICFLFANLVTGEYKAGDKELIMDFIDSSNKMMNPGVEGLLKNFPALRHLPFGVGSLYTEALAKRDRLLKRFVDDVKSLNSHTIGKSLVSDCLRIQAESTENCWLDDDMIKGVVLDTIGGGVIALTNTLLGLFLNLLNHQNCKERMHAEIDDVLHNRFPSYDDVSRMPYSYAVVLETSRHCSIVPIVSHRCSKPNTEFEGFTIPDDAIVFGNIWSAHHDPNTWGDPWVFRPERFLDDQGKLLPVDSQLRKSLFPMGLGARYCVGRQFSYKRLFVFAVALFQRFDILPPENGDLLSNDPRLYSSGAVLQMDNFKCRVIQRARNTTD